VQLKYLITIVILSKALLCSSPLEASEHYSDHELFCFSLPKNTDCFTELQRQLQQQQVGSKNWYKLESYLLDYYYDKIDFHSLKLQAEMLLQRQDVPSVVLAQLYFYYAKTMMHFNQPEQAEAYGLKAAHLVTELYKSFGNPLRLVELANLQKALGQHELAVQTLSEAEHRAGNSQDPIFWFELNSNKALISDSTQSFEESLLYRQRALAAILTTAHNVKIVVAIGNLARTEQLLGHYEAALSHYQQSLAYMSKKQTRKTGASTMSGWQRLRFSLTTPNSPENTCSKLIAHCWGKHTGLFTNNCSRNWRSTTRKNQPGFSHSWLFIFLVSD